MKKLVQLSLLALTLGGFARSGWAAEQKIATFNLRKAFESYYKTLQSNAALKQEGEQVEKERAQMIEDARRHEDEFVSLREKANDQAVSAAERDKSKQAEAQKYAELKSDKDAITTFENEAASRFQEKKKMRTDEIVKEIVGILTAHAKASGYSMVLDTSGESANTAPVVLYSNGQDDLTDGIIKELNAAAPPGSLDTNAPAGTLSTNAPNALKITK